MTLGTKMITSVLACGLVPLAAVSYFSLTTAKRGMEEVSDKGNVSLEKQAYNQLLSVRDVKKRQIETYFAERKGDMGVLVENVATLRQQAFNNLIALREVKKKQIENYFSERKGDMGVLVETVNTLRAEAFNKLQAIQEQKKSQIDDYFSSLRAQLDILKGDPYAQQALSEFSQAFEAGGDSVDSPEWKAVAEKYQARMKNIMDDNGWYDLFLIDAAGDIVYTVTRESDLGMVIPDSELKDSSLGKAFAKAQKLGAGEIAVGDFASYAPSNGAPAGFMMGKMVNDAGELVGYCALQIPTDKINKIMLRRHGMGKTGESYLVGQDKLMRSDSFLDPAGHSVAASFKNNTTSDTEAIRSALAGGENQAVIMDYNGNPVLSCWNPVEIGSGVRWAMMSEIDVAEAFSPKIEGAEKDFFTRYKEQYGYYDLFLLNPDGYCFYTVAQEADYQTNLVNGKYADSNLGEVVQRVLQTRAFGFADFKPYEPSNGEPCAFIAQPVVHEGKVELIVALQLPLDAVNNIMGVRAGMGETGETYLIGPDKLMRSDSFLDPTNHTVAASFKNPSKGSVNTDAAKEALAGKTDAGVIMDYNNNPVLSAYTPIDVFGTTWGLLAEIDVAEAFCPKDKNGVYFYKKYAEMYGYYDLFLINPDGYCFYTVAQEADYQTNLVNGKYSSSNLGKLTRQVLANKSFGFADFEPYAPSNGEPAAFIAQPVVHEGKTEIIVALQLPLDAINGIMGVRAGMGETGETYLIGPDKLMRSDSFLDPTNHTVAASFKNPTAGSVDTDAARAALSGGTDAKLIIDYNGNPVLSAYAPIDVFGTRWALLAEIDESEALAAVVAMKETSDLAVANLLKWGAGTAAVASVLLVMVGVLMARSITKPINRAIVGLTDGADQVTGAAGQVSSASQQLAEGASEQASSLEETSSSLEQMAAMTRTNASSAKEASQLATQARKNADEGEQIMGQLGSAMSAINQSSGEIGKIIKVIEEIAFQTNLLALNAAVEAARAGEHGKGFAVVAEEVRNLAQRSAKSARDTNDRIGESIERAKEGVEVSGKASKSLQSIVTDVSKVAELLNGISQASNEQAQGVEQVNTAVSQMDKVTQQNAAGAEESASAAEQLSAQARTVKGMVDELRAVIGGGGSEPVTPRALQTRKKPLRKKAGSDKGATGRALPRDFSAAAKDATGKSADKEMPEKEYAEALGEF